jgi:diguanylate cyclase (GGDEF)-like protein
MLHSLSLARLGGRVLKILGLISLILVLLWLWFVWTNTKQTHLQRTRMVSSLVAGYADEHFGMISESMRKLGENLTHAGVSRNLVATRALLGSFNSTYPDFVGVAVFMPDGKLLAATGRYANRSSPDALSDPEWRKDFESSAKARDLTVNRVQYSRLAQQWMIPLLYAVRDKSNNVVLLLQVGIRVDHQEGLWRDFHLGDNAYVELLSEDGYLISRFPDPSNSPEIYRKQTHAALVEAFARHDESGAIDGMITGEKRIGGYARLRNYPLYAALSFPETTVNRVWWRSAQIPLYIIIGVLLGVTVIYWIAARRFAARMLLIQQQLERTDVVSDVSLQCSGVSEIDNLCEALAHSQNKLREALQNREKMLLAATAGGTYAINLNSGRIVAADEQFLNMLGKSADRVIGQPWYSLLANNAVTGTLAARQYRSVTHQVLKFNGPDDSLLWLSIAEYQDQVEGEVIRYGLAIDVTERELLLDWMGRQTERFHRIWEITTDRSKPDEEKMALMLALGLDTLGAQAAAISESCEQDIYIRQVIDMPGIVEVGQRLRIDDPLFGSSLSEKEMTFVSDLETQARFRDHPLSQTIGVRTFVNVPIWAGNRRYGTMTFIWTKQRRSKLAEDDRTCIGLLASWFGQTMLQQRQRDDLENLALTDALTTLPNRRAAEQRFAQELSRVKRDGVHFSLAICDLDHFKLVNDTYGHDTGDAVLRHTAAIMAGIVREGDWVARWGGEEFVVFLHHSREEEAHTALERLRIAIKSQPLQTPHGELNITVSIGVGIFRGESDLALVLAEADRCLYEAKASGRDRVVVSGATSS